jgi:hypothetical protein
VFESRVLRKIFASQRGEVTGDWRKLHNEDLRNLYSWLNDQAKEDEIGRACSTNGAKKNAYWIVLRKPEEKTPPK